MLIAPGTRKDIKVIIVKEMQVALKNALKKIVDLDIKKLEKIILLSLSLSINKSNNKIIPK